MTFQVHKWKIAKEMFNTVHIRSKICNCCIVSKSREMYDKKVQMYPRTLSDA